MHRNIGFFIEGYVFGGTERIIISTIKNWHLKKNERIILFCNKEHSGIKILKKELSGLASIVTYNSPSFIKKFFFKKNKTLNYFIQKIFYYTILNYVLVVPESKKFEKLFRKFNISVVFIHNGGWPAARTTRSAIFAASNLNLNRIFLIIHGLVKPHNLIFKLQENIIESKIKKHKINVITISKAAAKAIIDNTKLPRPKVIYNGTQKYSKIRNSKLEFNIPKNNYLILSAGTLDENRGHIVLLKSMSKLKKIIPNISLIIIGSGFGEVKINLKKYIKNYGLSKNVKIIKFSKNIRGIINISDVVINPVLFTESFGMVAIEAMAQKKPVIASKIGGIPEVVENNKTGYLIEPNNTDLICDRVLRLYNDKKLSIRLGNNGYKKFIKKFDVKDMVKNYMNLI